MIVRELLASLGFKVDKKGIDDWEKKIENNKKAMESLRSASTKFGQALATVAKIGAASFAGLAIAAAKVGGEFESLRASLKTVTGSSEAAATAFASIRRFATATPFSVKEITTAFIKLKALGLDPSEAALKSYGNTSSAMGKSLNEMIEAVADAATGEFERLKEFGIKSKSEGDRVSFTFQGVTTTVGKNAKEIEGYLRKIGDTTFAGAMDEQSKTLNGAFSNLGDAVEGFLDEVARSGLTQALGEIAREMAAMAGGSSSLAQTLGKTLAAAVKGLWERFRQFIPQIPRVVDQFKKFADVAFRVADVALKIIDAFGGPAGLIATLVTVSVSLKSVTFAMDAMGAASKLASGGLTGMGAAAGALGLALAGAAIIIGTTISKINELRRDSRATIEDIRKNAADLYAKTGISDDPVLLAQRRDRLRGKVAQEEQRIAKARASEDFVDSMLGSGASTAALESLQAELAEVENALDAHRAAVTNDPGVAVAQEREERQRFGLEALQRRKERRVKAGRLKQLQRESRRRRLRPSERKEAAALTKELDDPDKVASGPKSGKKKKKELTAEQILERDFGGIVKDKETGHNLNRPLGTTINRIEYKPQTTVTIPVTQKSGESGDDLAKRVAGLVTVEIGKVVRQGAEHFRGATVT